MAKRSAGNYLTDQNWDQEDESEEAGLFKEANLDVLEKREIKKAKRRGVTTGDSADSGTGGAFKGFSGFTGFTSSKPMSSMPSFGFGTLTNSKKDGEPGSFKFGLTTSSEKKPSDTKSDSEAKPTTTFGDSKATFSVVTSVPSASTVNGTGAKASKSKYLSQLKALNEGVCKWIKDHVEKSPYCILTPIFKDYEKHLDEIDKKYPSITTTEEVQTDNKPAEEEKESKSEEKAKSEEKKTPAKEPTPTTETKASPASTFSFGSGSTGGIFGGSSSPMRGSTFTFGSGSMPPRTSCSGQQAFSFAFSSTSTAGSNRPGLFAGTTSSESGFKPKSAGFSFGAAVAKATSDSAPGSDNEASSGPTGDDEYVPPKPEVDEVKEADAFYTKRCKLYFKKDDSWQEKGVGNLHLKPCGDKTQLLVRADTSLGNILLNILLSSSVPMTRQGKNNVAIMCIPNPPLDEKKEDDHSPVSMLIRVKTAEDADELLHKMKDWK